MTPDKPKISDIQNRPADYERLNSLIWTTEIGIRATWLAYDDHSLDKNSKDRVLALKENTVYRLFATIHQYLILIRELNSSEHHLHQIHINDPKKFNSYIGDNPHFEQVQLQISSVFDNIIFNLSSLFDYLSHMVCYISKTDKSKTLYWTKLAKLARDSKSDFEGEKVRQTIDEWDRNFVDKLYDYRSRLLHNKKDDHEFTANVKFSDTKSFDFDIKIIASKTSQKFFKIIPDINSESQPTLIYLSSKIIEKSLDVIDIILSELQTELESKSSFNQNLINQKTALGMFAILDEKTNRPTPISKTMWKEYKTKREKILNASG